jgi:Probable zinc-ribbon domain
VVLVWARVATGSKRRLDSAPVHERPELEDVVPHPRYGTRVVPSGFEVTEAEIRSSFWGYQDATIYPESVIPANVKRQNFSTFARVYYVDMLEVCRACERPFLFFAREQRHWYEVLRFYIDADCSHCADCRRKGRDLRRCFLRFSERIARIEELDKRELGTLVSDAVLLWEAGILRNEQRLRTLRNCARRRIPESRAAARIEVVVSRLGPAR